MKLSEKLRGMRADRPNEWQMDEYIRDAEALESIPGAKWRTGEPEMGREILAVFDLEYADGAHCMTCNRVCIRIGPDKYTPATCLSWPMQAEPIRVGEGLILSLKKYIYLSDLED